MRTRNASRIKESGFPLLELPDDVLANVLQRCPAGSIAGFPLPLVLAQVRVTGSVDPHWLRPLLHLGSKCPAVLDRVSMHLRSIELLEDQSTSSLIAIAPYLTRLERLSIDRGVSTVTLSALPTGLTKLSAREVDLEGASLEDLCASLLRLTALEDLDLGILPDIPGWALGCSLPRLRRLECSGRPPRDLGTFAPNLEAFEANLESEDLQQLPITLTRLMMFQWPTQFAGSLLPLTRLTGLKDLGLPSGALVASELPEVLRRLKDLKRIEIWDHLTSDNLPQLLDALDKGPEDLGLCLNYVTLYDSSPALERLFGHLVEVKKLKTNIPASLPWAALTRLTRLMLEVDGRKDASWIQPLSQLPSLRELEVKLSQKVPEGFDALTQCTRLELVAPDNTDNLSCLRRLTRLRECRCSCLDNLAVLPACLVKLDLLEIPIAVDPSTVLLTKALQHLTALEELEMFEVGSIEMGHPVELPPLERLTYLEYYREFYHLGLRLGHMPCLRSCHVGPTADVDDVLLDQLGDLATLVDLHLRSYPKEGSSEPDQLAPDTILSPLSRLSVLERLELHWKYIQHNAVAVLQLILALPLLDKLTVWDVDGELDTSPGSAWDCIRQLVGGRLRLRVMQM